MSEARIFAVSRHRLTTDGDGCTTLVTFNGCPLRCKYCLNKISWKEEAGKVYTPQTLFEEVKIDQLYFLATQGGITFGGGEPLLQTQFIREFRALCGDQWKLVAETSLNVASEMVQAADAVLDGYIVDIKDMNAEIYEAYTGKNNSLVLKNLEWLLQQGDPCRVTVRVPHIPDFNTNLDVAKSVEQLKAMGVTCFDEFEYIIR